LGHGVQGGRHRLPGATAFQEGPDGGGVRGAAGRARDAASPSPVGKITPCEGRVGGPFGGTTIDGRSQNERNQPSEPFDFPQPLGLSAENENLVKLVEWAPAMGQPPRVRLARRGGDPEPGMPETGAGEPSAGSEYTFWFAPTALTGLPSEKTKKKKLGPETRGRKCQGLGPKKPVSPPTSGCTGAGWAPSSPSYP